MESTPRVSHQNGGGGTIAEPPVTADSLARAVADVWSECLGGREVAPEDDFFAVGGSSLSGIKIIDRLAEDYGVRLSVRAFYLAQTPTRVAELIEQGRAAA
ncbi:phosphopantetheine-binding protein [Paractinoplanes lichenicola]|uniref:Acyl carrier protein n=1 Tax=Paractinoplanes lichenicola TaxID=2802976 RepID=A0ABS1VN33_9ACTN|nr:phosphopantetheine-binding protein [Actinoplanes lichenicola]MBL7256054.1 acyl carrier protein [Actinoplanes lichenicola]